MALQDEIFNIINKFFNPRIDELPPGEPTVGDYIPYWDKQNGITKRLEATALIPETSQPNNVFEWIPNRKDNEGNPMPYENLEVVTRAGNWYQSLADNNTSTPGQSDQWFLLTRSYTGGFWKPGLYPDDRPWVFSDHTGFTEIYELVAEERPFISNNIVIEEQLGLWVAMFERDKIEVVDTTGVSLIIDMENKSKKYFRGSDSVNSPLEWAFIRDVNAIQATVFFQIGSLSSHTFPQNVASTDPLFNNQMWTPYDIGVYKAVIDFNGLGGIYLQMFGPFRGGSNQRPSVASNTVTYAGGVLDGPYTYFDTEGDLENNPLPEVLNPVIAGGIYPGDTVTVTWDFYSPSGYSEGTHRYQWTRQNEDGSGLAEIPGVVEDNYTLQDEDINKIVSVEIVAVQTAAAPANGNPESLPTRAPGILVEEFIDVAPPALVMEDYYDYGLKKSTYNTGTFTAPVFGLIGDGQSWSSPAAGNRPTYNSGDGSLTFDRSTAIQWLETSVVASNSKGSAGTRTWEVCGVFQLTNTSGVDNNEYTMWSLIASIFMQFQGTGLEAANSVQGTFSKVFAAGTKYRFRLRSELTGTTEIQLRLQLNYNELANSYEFDETITIATGGAGWSAGNLVRLGGRSAGVVNRGFNGKIWENWMLFQAHLDPTKVTEMWRHLNAV